MWFFVFALLAVLETCGGATLTPTANSTIEGSLQPPFQGFVQAAYFANWEMYDANFEPTDIRPHELTHVLYAFADVSPTNGEILFSDPYADEQKHFPGDPSNEPGTNLYGCLKQLYLLKLANRQLKVLLSIGGWTYSQANHFSFIADADIRANFVNSAVEMIKNYGLDGVDIDFEFPSNYRDGQNLADLLTELRASFDKLASQNADVTSYVISVAASAVAENYQYYNFPQMNRAIDFWNLMSYDYSGPWITWADNQANLYGGSRTGLSTDHVVKDYISREASPNKILLGIPLYGRVFENTAGIDEPYDGVGPGTYLYKNLPLPGTNVFYDTVDVTSYSYDATKHELVSFDVPDIVELKAKYVVSNQLGGCMFWELSMDKSGCESLIQTAADVLEHLDQTLNHIHYPESKFDNVRNNMGVSTTVSAEQPSNTPTFTSSTTSTSTSTSSTTSTSTSTSSTSYPEPSGGSTDCAHVPAWTTGVAYFSGRQVIYDGHLWTAKWWTLNDVPGGTAGVWKEGDGCA